MAVLRDMARGTLVGGLALLASLLNFLAAHQYPLFTPEVLVICAFLVLVAALVAAVYARAGALLRAVLEVVLLFIVIDLNLNGINEFLAIGLIMMVFFRHLMIFIGLAAAVVFASILPGITFVLPSANAAGQPPQAVAGGRPLPPLVHIVFDEHIGVEGLMADTSTVEAGEDLKSFLLENGFHVSGGAYGEYFRTLEAVPSLLNFGGENSLADIGESGNSVTANLYFDLLNARGYALNVIQSPYLRYCAHKAVSSCWTHPPTMMFDLERSGLPVWEKLMLIGLNFSRKSQIYDLVTEYRNPFGIMLPPPELPYGIVSAEILSALTRQLHQRPSGSAFFVHVLFPHYPYVYGSDCAVKPMSQWLQRQSIPRRPATLSERQAAYAEQLQCLRMLLQPVLDAAGQDAIVIVQGDHGSRMTEVEPFVENLGKFSPADMIAVYSALFAVRAPGIPASYDPRAVPQRVVLEHLVRSGFRSAEPELPDTHVPFVVIHDRSRPWAKTKHPLPADWPRKR